MSSIFKYDYSKEIKTNEWQRKSGHIKERDNYTCQLCGSQSEVVAVHHRFYDSQRHYWDYPDESLITLCEKCHDQESLMVKNITIATDAISKTVNTARNSGVMYIEIIKAINSIAEKLGLNTGVCEKKKQYNLHTKTYQKKVLYIGCQTIDDRKKTFLEELSTYGLKYEPNYIQSFAEHWTTFEKKKLRFENDSDFLMPTYLANWKEKRLKIEIEKDFSRILNEAEKYARGQLEGYRNIFEPLIVSAKKEIEENAPKVNALLLEMFHSKAEDMKNTKVKEIIPSFQNRDRTVYDYLVNVNRPAAFAEIYKIEQGLSSYLVRHGVSFSYDGCIIKPSFIKGSGVTPKLSNIKAIEEYFNINLWLPIPFAGKTHYIMDSDSYLERQVLKYLLKYPIYIEMYQKYIPRRTNIDFKTFQMLYEANQAFKRDAENNRKKNAELKDIPLIDFCNLANIEFPDIDKNISLKRFINENILSDNFSISFCSISIKAHPEWIQVSNFSYNTFVLLVIKALNKVFGFTFLTSLFSQKYAKFEVPLEILSQTEGFVFDFDIESFKNGTMHSVLLPEHLQSADYYCDKIQELMGGYENI